MRARSFFLSAASPLALVALFVATCSSPGTASADEVLPLFTVESGGKTTAWWVEQQKLSPLAHALVEGLARGGVPVSDPDARDAHPRLSRVYRVPRLTPSNAGNLAGLYGASHAVIGTVVDEVPEPVPVTGLRRHRLSGDLRVLDVRSGIVLYAARIEREAQGSDAEQARQAAEGRFVEAMVALLAAQWRSASGELGVPRKEPWLVLTGASDAATVERLRAGLGAVAGVQGVRLAWVAPGRLAFDLNPDREDAPEELQRVVTALVAAPPSGLALRASAATGSILLIDVERVAEPEPPR